MIELFVRDKWRALAYTSVLAMFLFGAIINSRMISMVAFGVGCGVVLIQRWNPFPLLFLLFSYANIIKLGVGSSSLFTYLCMFVLLWWFLRRMTIKGSFLALLLFFFVYLVFVDENSLLVSFKLIVNLLLIYCFAVDLDDETIHDSVMLLTDGLILSLALSNVDWFFNRIIGYMRVVSFKTGTDITRSCGLFDDPNYCTLAITATISVLLVLYYKKKTTVLFWPRCVLLAAFGMMTYSKSYAFIMLAIVAVAVMFIIPKRNKWALAVVLLALSIFAYFAVNGRIEAVNRILDRFERIELTSGRTETNILYLQYLSGNIKAFLVGDGITITTIPTYSNNVHNLPIELIQRIGIIGTVLFISSIMSAMPPVSCKKKMVEYFPLVCVLVQYLALAGLTSYALPFYIMLSYASIRVTPSFFATN